MTKNTLELVDVAMKPGYFVDTTPRGAGRAGYWKGGDKIRFRNGLPETIEGWVAESRAFQLPGRTRMAVDWSALNAEKLIMFGTSTAVYAYSKGSYGDVTPVYATRTYTAGNIATTIGSNAVVITESVNYMTVGSTVVFPAATVNGVTLTGNRTVIASSATTYTVLGTGNATSTGTNAASVGSVTLLLPAGLDDTQVLSGFGIALYGRETYGTPRFQTKIELARTWSWGNWGEDMLLCPRGGDIYVWDASAGINTRATKIATAPTNNQAVFVSPEARVAVALGADGDPLYIRWSADNNYNDWTPTVSNKAGDFRLPVGNRIVRGIALRNEVLVFTDTATYAMQTTGGTYVFDFPHIGSCYGIQGPNAVNEFEGCAYWMGAKAFYKYDGVIRELPCPVLTQVFDVMDEQQGTKVWCDVNVTHGEVTWYYQSKGATECDRYVTYNKSEDCWYFGTMDRTVMVGSSKVFKYAYGVAKSGQVYFHTNSNSADGQPLAAYIESGDIELAGDASGTHCMYLAKYVPDFDYADEAVQLTINGKKYPNSKTVTYGPKLIDTSTEYKSVRMRARQISVRFDSTGVLTRWRLGPLRLEMGENGS